MHKTIIEATGWVELTYDENSPEFKEALKGYIDSMDKDGTKETMLKHVAFYIQRFGIENMVEGVGYVACPGNILKQPYSGITVDEDFENFDYLIFSTDEI